MTAGFEHAALVGAGLLGASLGLALKAQARPPRVTGTGRRQESLDAAMARGAIDAGFLDLESGLRGADLIVLCTPAVHVADILPEVRAHAESGAVITDVASTKAEICRAASAEWPAPRPFVGSHPMAGSEKFGPEHARADLYAGSICLVEYGAAVDRDARARVVALWESVGARVVAIDPEEHDRMLARSSHLPHIAASALAESAAAGAVLPEAIGQGFRDTTRIAEGRPELWRDICLTNREALLAGVKDFQERIETVRAALEAGDAAALEAFFARGRDARRELAGP